MAIPSVLQESLHDPVFWARYTFAHEEGPGADRLGDLEGLLDDDADEDLDDSSLDVTFEVGSGHHVVLSMDASADSYSLLIATPDSPEPVELGWDDLAHWHPHALRWTELDLICRAIATRDPRLPHPGTPLALLCRFAAVFDDDDVDQAVAAVDEAYAALRPPQWEGYWPSGADWLERADFRGANVVWQRDEVGNLWAHQDEDARDGEPFYSTRLGPDTGTGDGFPHAPLRAVLNAATVTVSDAGLTGDRHTF
ncbi:hypothetical protein [Micromonospora globbae]|uniref:Uncharacterized protein n=1 Tax=Micromonospora globbae TaxID=1894969 RepID=A0A420ETR4_9ACTN|nr:hypothetical protein [Micromonospora globbae]RKF24072.1 hypothetical protein D7I43_28360 [Micromonospora globbae]